MAVPKSCTALLLGSSAHSVSVQGIADNKMGAVQTDMVVNITTRIIF